MKQILKDKLQGGPAMTANSTFHNNAYLLSRAMWVIATFTEKKLCIAFKHGSGNTGKTRLGLFLV